jgi:hypothetical protein
MSKEWPLEGYFVCGGGGTGVLMTADCLGREFTSRTANYDLIIGLPQLEARWRVQVLPPQWTYGPISELESKRLGESNPKFWDSGACPDPRGFSVTISGEF